MKGNGGKRGEKRGKESRKCELMSPRLSVLISDERRCVQAQNEDSFYCVQSLILTSNYREKLSNQNSVVLTSLCFSLSSHVHTAEPSGLVWTGVS